MRAYSKVGTETVSPDDCNDFFLACCDLHVGFNTDGTLVIAGSLGAGKRCIRQFRFDKKYVLDGEEIPI